MRNVKVSEKTLKETLALRALQHTEVYEPVFSENVDELIHGTIIRFLNPWYLLEEKFIVIKNDIDNLFYLIPLNPDYIFANNRTPIIEFKNHLYVVFTNLYLTTPNNKIKGLDIEIEGVLKPEQIGTIKGYFNGQFKTNHIEETKYHKMYYQLEGKRLSKLQLYLWSFL
jgi:hypothetical protein